MNKGILISTRPLWCELIANGKKTVEVRKKRPIIDTPFPVYVYCTMPKTPGEYLWTGASAVIGKYADASNNKVIGEFVCDSINRIYFDSDIRYGEDFPNEYISRICNDSCLTLPELKKYANGKDVFGWHISDFVMYDKPKELSEFKHLDGGIITRPPQSWCYVEELQCRKA